MHYFIIKFPNKRELQQIGFSHSSDIDSRDFMDLYKPYSSWVIDTTLALDNPLRFRKNLSERIWKLIITIDDKMENYNMILTEKQ